MKLSDLASVAEIVAAAGIIVSLLFVGFEIRDGNRETRAATTQAALDAEIFFQAELINNSDVWQRVIRGGDLTADDEDRQRAIALYNMAMTQFDNRFQMANTGYVTFSEEAMRRMVRMQFFTVWRRSLGASNRSQDFLGYVDDLRSQVAAE